MTIEYNLNKKDFNIYLSRMYKLSPLLKRLNYFKYILTIVISYYAVHNNEFVTLLDKVIGFLIYCLFILIVFTITNWLLTKILYAGKKGIHNARGIIGKHQITLTEEFLIESTDYNENKESWKGIQSVNDFGDYIYIINAISAVYIIPKSAFPNNNVANDFFEMALRLQNQSNNAG